MQVQDTTTSTNQAIIDGIKLVLGDVDVQVKKTSNGFDFGEINPMNSRIFVKYGYTFEADQRGAMASDHEVIVDDKLTHTVIADKMVWSDKAVYAICGVQTPITHLVTTALTASAIIGAKRTIVYQPLSRVLKIFQKSIDGQDMMIMLSPRLINTATLPDELKKDPEKFAKMLATHYDYTAQLSNAPVDANSAMIDYLRNVPSEVKSLENFHYEQNVKSITPPSPSKILADAVYAKMRQAAKRIKVGSTVDMNVVSAQTRHVHKDLESVLMHYIVNTGLSTVVTPVLAPQPWFLPTATLGVWRRNTYDASSSGMSVS